MVEKLTEMQALYCDYKMEGLSNNEAALKAGYKPNTKGWFATNVGRSAVVHRELARRVEESLLVVAPMVLATIVELMESKCESIRLSAARDLADRIGLGESKASQQNITFNVDLS